MGLEEELEWGGWRERKKEAIKQRDKMKGKNEGVE